MVEPLKNRPSRDRQPPMAEEKKYEGAGDPIKLFLEEAHKQQRNEIVDKFSQILQRMPTGNASSSSSHLGGATPFKVQVNFYIPIFEGKIYAYVIYKWLNLLEGYFLVHNFSDGEKITFALLKLNPHVKD